MELLEPFENLDGDRVGDGVGSLEVVESPADGGGDGIDPLDELAEGLVIGDRSGRELAGARGDRSRAGVDSEAERPGALATRSAQPPAWMARSSVSAWSATNAGPVMFQCACLASSPRATSPGTASGGWMCAATAP
jgi:hypothetical protein